MRSVLHPRTRYLTSGLFRGGNIVISDLKSHLKLLYARVELTHGAVQITPLEGDETTQRTPETLIIQQ